MIKVTLEKGKEKLPMNHHPWVYSGAVKKTEGKPGAGDIAAVHDSEGKFIAYGHYNPTSKLIVRLLEWDANKKINEAWYTEKIKNAVNLRKMIISADTDIYRLIYSESDFLPGLIVDVYGEYLVLQSLTSGFDSVKAMIAKILVDITGAKGVFEKSTGDGRRMEGLAISIGPLAGQTPPDEILVRENGHTFAASFAGQKTGFFADQRANRLAAARFAKGREVLDVFSYTGAFSVYAMKAGAVSTHLCDMSKGALESAKRNLTLNDIDSAKASFTCADGFDYLRQLKTQGKKFGMIVLDPPKLAASRNDVDKAKKAYKDINMLAMHLLAADGILVTFSCSGSISMSDLREAVAYAAKDAGKEVRVLEHLHQAGDHAVRVSAPETEYLKGLICVIS